MCFTQHHYLLAVQYRQIVPTKWKWLVCSVFFLLRWINSIQTLDLMIKLWHCLNFHTLCFFRKIYETFTASDILQEITKCSPLCVAIFLQFSRGRLINITEFSSAQTQCLVAKFYIKLNGIFSFLFFLFFLTVHGCWELFIAFDLCTTRGKRNHFRSDKLRFKS